jgi:16S rRNA processing protein RimM
VLCYPANDVYVVGQGKSEILLPAVRDVVREVDLMQRRIVVTPTEGLLPEDHAD